MDDTRAEYIAVRLILAYMEPNYKNRTAFVWAVQDESGLSAEAFDLANMTACRAAMFWRDMNPELGKKLLHDRLEQLTGVPAT